MCVSTELVEIRQRLDHRLIGAEKRKGQIKGRKRARDRGRKEIVTTPVKDVMKGVSKVKENKKEKETRQSKLETTIWRKLKLSVI